MPEAPKLGTSLARSSGMPESHRRALEYIEDVTANAGDVQRRVLSEILSQNAGVEYLHHHGLTWPDSSAFHRLIPLISYEDIQPYIDRIAAGDKSPILSGRPISEFLTSSGTSGGERKLMPTIAEEMDRRQLLYSLLMPVMSQYVPGLDKGKAMFLFFVKSEVKTPGGLVARPVLTSYYKSKHYVDRLKDPYNILTSPTEAVLCMDSYQSMYAQLLCGLSQRGDVLRVGAVFASGFIRAIKFLEKHWQNLCRDIQTGVPGPDIMDLRVREAVSRVLSSPDPDLADLIENECRQESWYGIVRRIWPNTKYVDVIVTGAMSQYIPTLEFYTAGLPLACTMYGSSECYFGLNLEPLAKPADVVYTLIPTMAYFEFIPISCGNPTGRDLVDLVDLRLGEEYELVVTTYSGLYRYRVGDVLRVAGYKNNAPQFKFVRRKNVALSIDADKTDEVELQAAVQEAVGDLEPFGARLVEWTSYADTTTIPGHYVLYWELQQRGTSHPPPPASVFEDCCLAVEESLNAVYRQCRAADGSVGPLEIRIVEEGTFDKLMDFALSQGASINQYKAPRCVKAGAVVELLDDKVAGRYFSPKCPHWTPGSRNGARTNSTDCAC